MKICKYDYLKLQKVINRGSGQKQFSVMARIGKKLKTMKLLTTL